MAHDVFVSYAVKARTTADAIGASLEANGIRVWIAPGMSCREVIGGTHYRGNPLGMKPKSLDGLWTAKFLAV